MKFSGRKGGGIQRRTFVGTGVLVLTGCGGGDAATMPGLVEAGGQAAPPTTPPPTLPPAEPGIEAPLLTSVTLTAHTNGNRPWCCGQAFKQGDVPAGAALSGVQMNVKSTWPDGSARWAVLSGITNFPSGASTIGLRLGAQLAGPHLGTANLKATGITSAFDAGAFGSASWDGVDWDAPFEDWAQGPIMSSWIYRKPIGNDAHLVAWMEVRLWSTGDVEVLPWVENGYLRVPGATNKNAIYTFTLGGTRRFSEVIDLPNHTRTPLIGTSSAQRGVELSYWLGSQQAVIPRHDNDYLMATEMVPTYAASVTSGPAITTLPASYSPLMRGGFPAHSAMGTAGYDKTIGMLPQWEAVYLTSAANGVYEAVERNGYAAGHYGIVHRDENTNRPVAFSTHPYISLHPINNCNIPDSSTTSSKGVYTAAGSGTLPYAWKTSHHPSIGYLAALLSGRRYHVDTLQFSACIGYLKQYDLSRQTSQGVVLAHALSNQIRGAAWSLRTLAQAAALTPNSDPLKAEFLASWAANVDYYFENEIVKPGNPLGFVWGGMTDVNAYSRTGQTGSSSTATRIAIFLPEGDAANSWPIGWRIHIGGSLTDHEGAEVRQVISYDRANLVATVDSPFTIPTAGVSYYADIGPWCIAPCWQYDFLTAAIGYGKSLDLEIGMATKSRESALFTHIAQTVLGRLGSAAPNQYLYRDAAKYHTSVAASLWAQRWIGPWYSDWGQVWDDTNAFWGFRMNPKEIGDGTLRAGGGMTAGSYLANLQPAISYVVRHGIVGAKEKYALMTSASNWQTFINSQNIDPVWAVIPSAARSKAPAMNPTPVFAPPIVAPEPGPPMPGLPYSLPSVGEAKAISRNLPGDVRPNGWLKLHWHYSTFGSFGGGAFVPTYSRRGAYVLAGTGGHGHPDHVGAAVFDFDTGEWTRLDCANDGLPYKAPGAAFSTADTDGEPLLEIAGTEVPAPAHAYQMLCFSPGGARGGVIYVMRAASTTGARPSSYAHRFDLSTRKWSRASGPGDIAWGGSEASAVHDAIRNRWWLVPTATQYIKAIPYLDGSNMTWKSSAAFQAPPGSSAVYSRLMLHDGLVIRNSGPAGGLRLFDPDEASAGWVNLAVSGELPDAQNGWARHSDGRWYAYQGFEEEGNVLTCITPPANPKSGTWVVGSVAVSGDTLTAQRSSGSSRHYTRFFYVEPLDCLCWIPGADSAVYLIKPPA